MNGKTQDVRHAAIEKRALVRERPLALRVTLLENCMQKMQQHLEALAREVSASKPTQKLTHKQHHLMGDSTYDLTLIERWYRESPYANALFTAQGTLLDIKNANFPRGYVFPAESRDGDEDGGSSTIAALGLLYICADDYPSEKSAMVFNFIYEYLMWCQDKNVDENGDADRVSQLYVTRCGRLPTEEEYQQDRQALAQAATVVVMRSPVACNGYVSAFLLALHIANGDHVYCVRPETPVPTDSKDGTNLTRNQVGLREKYSDRDRYSEVDGFLQPVLEAYKEYWDRARALKHRPSSGAPPPRVIDGAQRFAVSIPAYKAHIAETHEPADAGICAGWFAAICQQYCDPDILTHAKTDAGMLFCAIFIVVLDMRGARVPGVTSATVQEAERLVLDAMCVLQTGETENNELYAAFMATVNASPKLRQKVRMNQNHRH